MCGIPLLIYLSKVAFFTLLKAEKGPPVPAWKGRGKAAAQACNSVMKTFLVRFSACTALLIVACKAVM